MQDAGPGQYYEGHEPVLPQTQMLMAVDPDGFGGYMGSDTISVIHADGVRVYEGDIVQVWGQCLGSYTYESVAGYTITVPCIYGVYFKKV